ncbi:hypothetical protein QCA50_012390 [Cerrena zonata]|uniref:Uncharacterized protein n=1 Tax=Cerrena zonata TaxID=2478898 RepID=A0AAW0FS21_9APHY
MVDADTRPVFFSHRLEYATGLLSPPSDAGILGSRIDSGFLLGQQQPYLSSTTAIVSLCTALLIQDTI